MGNVTTGTGEALSVSSVSGALTRDRSLGVPALVGAGECVANVTESVVGEPANDPSRHANRACRVRENVATEAKTGYRSRPWAGAMGALANANYVLS